MRRSLFIKLILVLLSLSGFLFADIDSQDLGSESMASLVSRADDQDAAFMTPLIHGELTLDDALGHALKSNKVLLAAMQNIGMAKGRLRSSRSGQFPTLSFLASYVRYDKDACDNQARASVDEYSTGIRLTQPIYHGGAIGVDIQIAKLETSGSVAGVRRIAENTLYHVASGYFHVLLARRLLGVSEDAVLSAKAHLNEVSKKHERGLATPYNVLRAQVDVSLYEAEMIQRENTLNLAKTKLLKGVGFNQKSQIELTEELVCHLELLRFEENLEQARQCRPDLELAEIQVLLGEEAVKKVKSRYRPQINAYASGGWSKPDPYHTMDNEWNSDASAGITVEFPFFDGFRRDGQRMEAIALLRKRKLELQEMEERIDLEVHQAYLSLQNSEKFVDSQKMNLQQASEGLRLAEAGYRQGVNADIDVTDARSTLTKARGLHYQAIYNQAMSLLTLRRATGTLLTAYETDSFFSALFDRNE